MNDTEIVAALSERNLQLMAKGWLPCAKQNHKNLAVLDARGIPFEYLAFHLGPENQSVLKSYSVVEQMDVSLGYVFFSTGFNDFEFYAHTDIESFLKKKEEMVYFADLRKVTEARVQKSYPHRAMFQDAIVDKLAEYKAGRCKIKNIKSAMNDWLLKYTVLFNPSRIARIKNRKDYVLLRSPLQVLCSG